MIKIEIINKHDWTILSERVHAAVFSRHKPASWDRIDYVLLVYDDDTPVGYISCREYDHETIYWQFGGAFQASRNSIIAYRAYIECIKLIQKKYKRITTKVENTNINYLKMALNAGFIVVGTVTIQGSVLCELLLEFKEDC